MIKVLYTFLVFISYMNFIDCCGTAPLINVPIQPQPFLSTQPPSNLEIYEPNEVKEGPRMPEYCMNLRRKLCRNCFK